MKKYYHLKYLFTGGQRDLKYDNLQQFAAKLDEAMQDEHVIQNTITFWVEEK